MTDGELAYLRSRVRAGVNGPYTFVSVTVRPLLAAMALIDAQTDRIVELEADVRLLTDSHHNLSETLRTVKEIDAEKIAAVRHERDAARNALKLTNDYPRFRNMHLETP